MSGDDLRVKENGITLIIVKSFSSERGAQKGLARVGRFAESCTRIKLKNIELADDSKNSKVWSRLFACNKRI
jgi:hypothetical protein